MLTLLSVDTLLSGIGIVGAFCCISMYVAVCLGWIGADEILFFVMNGVGSLLIVISAGAELDSGDIGSVGQDSIWALVSIIGAVRAWRRTREANAVPAVSTESA